MDGLDGFDASAVQRARWEVWRYLRYLWREGQGKAHSKAGFCVERGPSTFPGRRSE